MDASSATQDRLRGRSMKVGVYVTAENRFVAERVFDSGADVTVGGDASAALIIPGWVGSPLTVFSGGAYLHLGPGMRVHMCHDEGEDRVRGTFEELSARGFTFPLRVTVSKLNISLGNGVTVLVHYLPEGTSA